MSRTDLTETARKLREALLLAPRARANMADARGGPSAHPTDGPGGARGGAASTPTERQALAAVDPASQALAEFDRLAGQLRSAVDGLWGLVNTWARSAPPPVHATKPDQLPDAWCASCARNDWTHRSIATKKDGRPVYAEPPLCQWCGRYLAVEGVLPPLEYLRIRHRSETPTARLLNRERRTMRRLGLPNQPPLPAPWAAWKPKA